MADIANQLEGAVEGLDRFLEALDNSSMKLGSNAAIESKLARAAAKKADQELRFKKKIDKMEKEIAKREAQHLIHLKKAEPFRKRAFASLKQELKAKTDLIKQTKGLGDALKKTGAGLGGMFKALGKGISDSMSGLGKGFKGGIAAGLGGIMENLKGIQVLGISVGKIIGAIAAGVKVVYDITMSYRKLQQDIVRQTGQFVDNQEKITESAKAYQNQIMETYNTLGLYGYKLKETVKMTQDLRETFGDVSYVTSDLVKASAELQISYRMADTEANNLIESTERAGFGARDFHKTMKETAIVMGADVGMAMRDAAKNSQMIELYAGRGEEYFARMATRATMLGTSMSALEKSGETFADFESASEAIGRMTQLFGTEFADGLKNMNELRMMYERGDVLGIQEHIAEQTAKTLYFEKGILKSRKTGEMLWMSQIKAHADVMKTDEVTAKRMLESGALLNEMRKEGFSLDAKGNEDLKKAYASEFDFVMAMKGATKKTNEEIMATLQGKGGLEELMKLSREEIAVRQQEAKDAADLPKQTLASMSELTKAMNSASMAITKIAVSGGEEMDKVVGPLIERMSATTTGFSNAISTGLQDFISGDDKSIGKLTDVFKNAGGAGLEKAFPDIFAAGSTTNQSFAGMVERGLVAALGGEKGAGLWDVMKERMMEAWDYGVEKFTGMLRTSWRWLEDIFHTAILGLSLAFDKLDFFGTGGADAGKIIGEYNEAQAQREKDRADADFERSEAGQRLRAQEERKKRDERRRVATGQGQIDMGAPVTQSQMADVTDTLRDQALKATNPWEFAKGWSGAAHRGIVGEAGTEVGITKSALRELSSIGIPGYQYGRTIYGQLMSDREGLSQARGSVGGKMGAHASSRGEQGRYRNSLNNFLRRQDEITQERQEDWKDFFVRYPAVIDEAFGEPFRQGGPVVEGIYNSVFSGMQASTRAELAGADKDTQRQLMYQHMTAEGLKPGGIIDQGLGFLNKHQTQLSKTFGEGFEKEEERANKLAEASNKSYAKLEAARLDDSGVNAKQLKKLEEIAKIDAQAAESAWNQVEELKELQKRGEVWNRTSVGLLSGIQSGLDAYAGVIAGGGSKKQAKEMAKRGVVSGVLGNIAQQLGGGNQDFLNQMNTMGVLMGTMPMPTNMGGNVSDLVHRAMAATETTFQSQGRGVGWGGGNAQGRVYNSPHLAMVGEGSQNEIIIPTERIRKGLPINAGVAKELGSIGVPGYNTGTEIKKDDKSFFERMRYGQAVQQQQQEAYASGNFDLAKNLGAGAAGSGGVAGRLGHSLGSVGGFGGIAATGILAAAQTYQQTGDIGAAAGQGLGAGIGLGATVALSAIPGVGPIIGPILGPMIGSWAGGKLSKWMGKKPRYGRYRGRAIRAIEDHVSTQGRFRWGQPEEAEENLIKAISGKEKNKPSDKHYNILKKELQASSILGKGLRGGNVDSFIGLLTGQIGSTGEANQMYKGFNNLFYGTPMAKGGIVTGPTSAIIGEKGPEAVIPLDRYGGYPSRQQQENSDDMVKELKKQNQQMQVLIKNMGDAKTVLNVDGRQLAETVGENMYAMNTGM